VKHQRVVVIGYGNTLRSDDGYGPRVAERLLALVDDARVRVLVRPLLSVDLVGDLEQCGLCVLVDAATTGSVGELQCREIAPASTEIATLGHELAAASLIGLSLDLSGHAPQCALYSVVPESLEIGEELTPRVAELVDAAVSAIRKRIDNYWAEVAGIVSGD
jgi:hydrogenase maturation protease